jgi:threonine/homoserine/homoserine lactone efflux protein
MNHYEHLWLFFVLVFGVVLLPGMDMAYISGSALTGGRKAGLTALAGVVVGGMVHVTMGALGLSVVLKLFPSIFKGMLIVGALYIAWIGLSILRSASAFNLSSSVTTRRPSVIFRQGMLSCLMNPKAYLFMLAVFPQFFRPEYGPLWIQAIVMWVIIAATQIGVYGSIALAAGSIRTWIATSPEAGVIVSRVVGTVLILAAVATGMSGWRA